jgi:hypothetical protein
MRAARLAVIGIAALSMASCAYGVKLHADDTRRAAASSFFTFFVLQGNSSGTSAIDRELKAEVEAALADCGMIATPPDEAKAVVIVHAATTTTHSRDTFYQGWGGWAWRLAGAGGMNPSETYKPGTIVVDIFDAWSKQLVWHGSAPNALSGRSGFDALNTRAIRSAVASVFRNLPSASADIAWHDADAGAETHPADQTMKIIFAPSPALLVRIDGEPQYEDVTGTPLQRIANMRALIVRDEAGIYYFRLGDRWMQSYELTGDWSPAGIAPEGADLALRQAASERNADLFTSVGASGPMPVVFVSTTAADLIVTDGSPQFVAVDGTSLLHVRNTTATIFKEPTDQQLYVHTSTGWFRAWTMNGPWQRVSESELPGDLTRT